MIEQFDEYIHSATHTTIPWFNIKIPNLFQTQNGKIKIETATEIGQELSLIINYLEPALKQQAQPFVDLTISGHRTMLEKLRIDSNSALQLGRLEKLIQSYFYLLKVESPNMQVYSDSFLAEADFHIVPLNDLDCKKYLITFLIKQYFMCCVEVQKRSILNSYQDLKSIAEDAHYPELKKLISDTLKISNTFQNDKLSLIRIIDALTIKVANDSILSKKADDDPLLKHFLSEIGILKALITEYMRNEAQDKMNDVKHKKDEKEIVSASGIVAPISNTAVIQTPVSCATAVVAPVVTFTSAIIAAEVVPASNTTSSPQTASVTADTNLKQSVEISASGSLTQSKYATPLIMSRVLGPQATGSQPTDSLCSSIISTDSLDAGLNASIASLEAFCIASQSLPVNK